MYFPGQKPLSMAEQKLLLEQYCLTDRCDTYHGHSIRWVGRVRPSETMGEYKISVSLALNGRFVPRPRVFVLDPSLQTLGGRPCDHLYPDDGGLCLYFPPAGEWGPHMALAKTTVPWASRWLYFYELWLATGGIWLGGGIHPESSSGCNTRTTPLEQTIQRRE